MPVATAHNQITDLPDGTPVQVRGTAWTKSGADLTRNERGTDYRFPISTLMSADLSRVVIPEPTTTPVQTLNEEAPVAHTVNVIQGLEPHTVQRLLHEYLENHGGLTSTEREGVCEVLDNLGLDRPAEEVTVTIRVEGSSDVTISDSYIENEIGGGVSTTDSYYEVSVDWTREFEVEEVETSTGCACARYDTDAVEHLVRDNGISGSVNDYSLSCSGSNCEND